MDDEDHGEESEDEDADGTAGGKVSYLKLFEKCRSLAGSSKNMVATYVRYGLPVKTRMQIRLFCLNCLNRGRCDL